MLPELHGGDSTDAQLRLERLVFGSDNGADGWTTIKEADKLARRLELRTPRSWRYDSHPRDDQRTA